MEQFLLREFWGNSVLAYMEVLVTVIATLFFKRYISKYFAGLFLSIFSSHAKGFHKKSFLELIIKPLESFLLLFIIVIAFDKLSLPSFLQFYIFRDVDFKSVIESLVNGALIILFIRFCVRSITFAALVLSEKVNNNGGENTNQLVVFFKDFFRIILIITGVCH